MKSVSIVVQAGEASQELSVELRGELSVAHLVEMRSVLEQLDTSGFSAFSSCSLVDGGIDRLDTAACLILVDFLGEHFEQVDTSALQAEHKRLLKPILRGIPHFQPATDSELSRVQSVGLYTQTAISHGIGLLALFGETLCEAWQIVQNPKRFRRLEFLVALESTCLRSLPVVSLVVFLIGLVIAYIFAEQIRSYGASIFIVDGVTIAMTRELCPLIVATVMAGRSGSAFTAQIGSMKMNQEIDALEILGLTPNQVLVFPRVLALVIAMPLLVVAGNVIGVFGGMLIANIELGVSFPMFLDRIQNNIAFRHFVLGIIKAPFFALCIAIIGCRMGLNVESNTRSVGSHTTSTVVQSIVAVIILDAIFAIVYMKLDL